MAAPPCRLVFESFGVVAEVVVDDRELFDTVPGVLPPGWRPHDGTPTARFRLRRAGGSAGQTYLLGRLGESLRRHVALHAPDHIFIHAGVVCAAGRAIVIPGRSHSGKTTLVAALLGAQATYCSDEYAVVDSEGMIHPYPQPLSVRAGGADGVPVAIAEALTAGGPVRAGLIVVTSYRAGAEWRPREQSRSEGALALLSNTVAARSRPAQALAAVCRLAQGARVLCGERGEARETVQALLARPSAAASDLKTLAALN